MPALNYGAVAQRMGITVRRPLLSVVPPAPIPQAPATATVRPGVIEEVIGQEAVRVRLMTVLKSARIRGAVPPHCLFYGPPGLGKTTLARVVSGFTGGKLVETNAITLSSPRLLALELAKLGEGDVFYIDEIHRLTKKVTESLYTAMEDGFMMVATGSGKDLRTVRVDLEPFTLVGATTQAGNIMKPLFDRFGFAAQLEYYTDDELARIILRAAPVLSPAVAVTAGAAAALGRRSRGTPRVALNMLDKARDYGTAMAGAGVGGAPPEIAVDVAMVDATMELYGIDSLGLDPTHQMVLQKLCHPDTFYGGPVGLGNLAAVCGEDQWTIADVVEPWLIRAGLMVRKPRGRTATEAAYVHLGWPVPVDIKWR